jgi:hypothetical protein
MTLFCLPRYRCHSIQAFENGLVKWALGIFESGEKKAGYMQYLYRSSESNPYAKPTKAIFSLPVHLLG